MAPNCSVSPRPLKISHTESCILGGPTRTLATALWLRVSGPLQLLGPSGLLGERSGATGVGVRTMTVPAQPGPSLTHQSHKLQRVALSATGLRTVSH